jgi:A/G-specific adenine glycosylase
MIAVEMRMSPSVFEISGEGLSVQFTNSARRSEKSQRLVVHNSSWNAVSVMNPSFSLVPNSLSRVEALLLDWFALSGRDLPWRGTRDPYAILVSEVMLQQTQVERVVPRYRAWLERWPTVAALADASAADVIREWQGLGYNRRALNLHRAAKAIAAEGWPDDLRELPGVGPYTAAAIRCFALEEDVLPVDVNVERVQRRTAATFTAASAQALMDLGSTICLARIPRCGECPLAAVCPSRGIREAPTRRQGPFEGSFRQRRAETLRSVVAAPGALAELDGDAARSLERDGLVVIDPSGTVVLPT